MSASRRMGPERAQPLALRASDDDREAVVNLLRSHAIDGRLDARELEERIGRALDARTRGDLAALVEDLPATGPAPRREGRERAWRAEVSTFVAVQALLVAIWALSGFGYFWPAWVIFGWGIPLLLCRPGSQRRRARTAVEQALGVRPDRAGGGSAGRQPALER